jgi:pentatricopeptide repeat protein
MEEPQTAPQAAPTGSRRFMDADDRIQLVAINREIATCATRKDIAGATAAFHRARAAGWANTHTFSAMINTHVRCGDIDGAVAVFNKLRASTIKLDVVSCTTMIKGHCSVGDIGGAVSLLHEMKRRNLAVNIRTINTIIRGMYIVLILGLMHIYINIYAMRCFYKYLLFRLVTVTYAYIILLLMSICANS